MSSSPDLPTFPHKHNRCTASADRNHNIRIMYNGPHRPCDDKPPLPIGTDEPSVGLVAIQKKEEHAQKTVLGANAVSVPALPNPRRDPKPTPRDAHEVAHWMVCSLFHFPPSIPCWVWFIFSGVLLLVTPGSPEAAHTRPRAPLPSAAWASAALRSSDPASIHARCQKQRRS